MSFSGTDPLSTWLMLAEFAPRDPSAVKKALRELERSLQSPSKNRWPEARFQGMRIPAEHREMAESLYRQVVARGGAGTTYAQEELLNAIGGGGHEASIPFWVEQLELRRPRDKFGVTRRRLSVAALAFLVMKGSRPAFEVLREHTSNKEPEIRGACIDSLAHVFLATDRPVPAEVLTLAERMAVEDDAFLPRYLSRRVLWLAERPLPEPPSPAAYRFRVKLSGDDFKCEIDVDARRGLGSLHDAIQDAYGWDNDHLFAFYLSGDRRDSRFSTSYLQVGEPGEFADEATLGQLGLGVGVELRYHFDFGDDHMFDVRVVKIVPKAEGERYPRVVSSSGTPPEQYPGAEW